MTQWFKDHFSPWWILALVLCAPVIEITLLVHNVRPGIEKSAWALNYVMDCKKTGAGAACLPSQTLATIGSIKAASSQSYQASKQIQATAKESLNLVTDAHKDLHSLLVAATGTLREATLLEKGLREDTHKLLESSNSTIKQAGETLKTLDGPMFRLDALLATADKQLSDNGTVSKETIAALTKAIGDISTLLESPDIAKILFETAGTSEHLNESAKSLDEAMRPWREKANMLKTLLSHAVGMLKFTAPLF